MNVTRQHPAVCWHDQIRYRPEILAGRILAACVHPLAGWRLLSTAWRVAMLAAYAATAYLTVLAALWF
jgi:hypothetical protein